MRIIGVRLGSSAGLTWWEWTIIGWIATGLAVIAMIELASRSGSGRGPLSQERALSSVAYSTALIVGAPLIVIYSGGICIQMLWGGRLPISNRIWWPARAANVRQLDLPRSRSAIVVEMIEVRRRKDSRLRQLKPPTQWPMFQLWDAPETTLLSTVEDFGWLIDAGLDDLAAVRRLVAHNIDSEWSFEAVSTIREFAVHRLRMVDPIYVNLGDEVLTKAFEIAEQWTKRKSNG